MKKLLSLLILFSVSLLFQGSTFGPFEKEKEYDCTPEVGFSYRYANCLEEKRLAALKASQPQTTVNNTQVVILGDGNAVAVDNQNLIRSTINEGTSAPQRRTEGSLFFDSNQ